MLKFRQRPQFLTYVLRTLCVQYFRLNIAVPILRGLLKKEGRKLRRKRHSLETHVCQHYLGKRFIGQENTHGD